MLPKDSGMHDHALTRSDFIFFAYVAIGCGIAFPLDQPWRAATFAIVSALFISFLGVWSIVGRRQAWHLIDHAALFFYGYMAAAIAVAQFFEPPITAYVVAGSSFVLLLGLLARVKLRKHQSSNGPIPGNDLQT